MFFHSFLPDNHKVIFQIKEFQQGKYIALESNILFRPRIELTFNENVTAFENKNCKKFKTFSELSLRLNFGCSSWLFQVIYLLSLIL